MLPASVTAIGDFAFSGCYRLTNFQLPAALTEIGEYAFKDCWRLASLEVPAAVVAIGAEAFFGCDSLESVTFATGSGLLSLGRNVFTGCTSLTTLEIPATVVEIGANAFHNLGCCKGSYCAYAAGMTVEGCAVVGAGKLAAQGGEAYWLGGGCGAGDGCGSVCVKAVAAVTGGFRSECEWIGSLRCSLGGVRLLGLSYIAA